MHHNKYIFDHKISILNIQYINKQVNSMSYNTTISVHVVIYDHNI